MRIVFKSWIDFYTLRVNIFGMERQDEAREALESDKDSNGEELDEKTRKYYEEMIRVPTRLEIATTLLNLLEDEETSFWNFDDNTSDEKMKKFTDYFAEYIHYMWD